MRFKCKAKKKNAALAGFGKAISSKLVNYEPRRELAEDEKESAAGSTKTLPGFAGGSVWVHHCG